MSVIVPHVIAALPAAPSTASPSDFDAKADAFLAALATLRTDINQTATDTSSNATDAEANALSAVSSSNAASDFASQAYLSAAAAATASGAAVWVSGATYAYGVPAWSPANRLIYRRINAGAGTIDPSADPTNWAVLGSLTVPIVVVAGTAQTSSNGVHYVLSNVSASTLMLHSPVAGDTVWVTPVNGLLTNIVNRGGQLIMGLAEDMTLNTQSSVQLRFINSTFGWRIL